MAKIIEVTEQEEKVIEELRKPLAARVAEYQAKAKAYRKYQETLAAIDAGTYVEEPQA